MKPVDSTAHSLMDEMLQCANEDGIIPVFNAVLTIVTLLTTISALL
jgi:hypothetical protein